MQWLGITYQDVTCYLTGRVFNPKAPRDMRFKTHRCMDYRSQLIRVVSGVRECGTGIQSYLVGQCSERREEEVGRA
jgi:hypothetical protein